MLSEMAFVVLDKPAKNKLQIMEFLFTEALESVSLAFLCEKFSYTYPTIQTLCNELQQDFHKMDFLDFRVSKGKISWCSKNYPYRAYQQFLIQQSIPYRWLKTTLLHPKKTIDDFCYESFVSRTTLTRRMKPLTNFLARFDIRLNLSKMQLQSLNEASIRVFYAYYFWLGSFGEELATYDELARKENNLLENSPLSNLNFIHPKETLLFFTISRLRADAGFYLRETPFKELIFPEAITALSAYTASFITDPIQKNRHIDFLGYMIYYYPYFVDESDERLPFIYDYFHMLSDKNDELAGLVYELLSYIEEKNLLRPLSQPETRLLKINFFKAFLNYSIFKEVPFPSIELSLDNDFSELGEIVCLSDVIESFLKKVNRRKDFDWLKSQRKNMAYTLATTLLPFYSPQQLPVSLNVTVIPTPDYLAMKEIREYLENLKFVNYAPFSTDLREIDLCIASSEKLVADFSGLPSFIIPFEHPNFYKRRLFDQLLTLHNKKKFG